MQLENLLTRTIVSLCPQGSKILRAQGASLQIYFLTLWGIGPIDQV